MYKKHLKKPDGRNLYLYSRKPIADVPYVPVPRGLPSDPDPQMRWHPLRGEWVAYASYRQGRTFLPPPEYNPLAPSTDQKNPTELPPGDYDVAVFENSFPSLTLRARDIHEAESAPVRPAKGVCEVVVYTQDPNASLGTLPLSHLKLILQVWADRYIELGRMDQIQYVMPFENRGVEVGVTLHHPHGQIYAYPFVPSIPERELFHQSAHFKDKQKNLLQELIEIELEDGRRILHRGTSSVAFVPAFARYTYEVWIAPIHAAASVADLKGPDIDDFVRTLKTVLLKFDGLWGRPFPYIMVFHQAPTDGVSHPEAHFHLEFYPPYRTRERLKYLAGTEIGAGMFTNDSMPEEKAAELQSVSVRIDESE